MTRAAADRPLVLIAEDDAPIAQVVAALVEDVGGRALVTVHGRQALEVARVHWPALLVTDLMMPLMTGAELIAALRTEAATRGRASLPVILLTAAGADVVLRKPFDLDALDRLVRRFLLP